MTIDNNNLNVNQSKQGGHRRVKSLVREFDEVKVKPSGQTSPPTSPTSVKALAAGHVRRSTSTSISYPSASIPSSSSPTNSHFTSTGPSISPSTSTSSFKTSQSNGNISNSSSTTSLASSTLNKRKGNVPSTVVIVPDKEKEKDKEIERDESVNEVIEGETPEEEEDAEESGDVFLPMSPNSATPYSVKFNNNNNNNSSSNSSTPNTPSFPRTGEHARKHSRIHERNLSAFFPRPGQEGSGYGDTYQDSNAPVRVAEVVDIYAPQKEEEVVPKANRRGHHHRHSISHNWIAEPPASTETIPNSPPNTTSPPLHSTSPSFLPVPTHTQHIKYSQLPYPVRFILVIIMYLPLRTLLSIGLSVAQIILGATLWIAGQNGESLSVTGLGYLVVFDGMGGLSRIFVEGSAGIELLWSLLGGAKSDLSVRLPFGPHRLVTLSHFSQAIYLLFSAVYVCKESVEHVLLLHGPNEKDGGHGIGHGMGHGDGGSISSGTPTVNIGVALPIYLLVLSATFSLISAVALRNHQQLADTVGPSGLSFSRPRSRSNEVSPFDLIGNPFTVTIVTFCVGLIFSAFVIPVLQLGPLDKVVALLQSIAMFYIAYPAAVATGQVLLQTSPHNNGGQMEAFTNALRDIENHPLVTKVSQPHLWQLTPHPSSGAQDTKSSAKHNVNSGRRSSATTLNDTMIASTLIVTLVVKINHDSTEADILSVGRFVKDRCGPAMNWGGDEAIEGELTVEVVREKKSKGVVEEENHSHHHHNHNHDTSHSHVHHSH